MHPIRLSTLTFYSIKLLHRTIFFFFFCTPGTQHNSNLIYIFLVQFQNVSKTPIFTYAHSLILDFFSTLAKPPSLKCRSIFSLSLYRGEEGSKEFSHNFGMTATTSMRDTMPPSGVRGAAPLHPCTITAQ